MTRTRLLAALVMAPIAIAAILLLHTPWVMALAAVLFLIGLWEWFDLAEIEDTLSRTVLLAANLALMVAIVWASRSGAPEIAGVPSMVLFKIASLVGVIWWLLALLWLQRYQFASNHESYARAFKLAAGTLSVIPAWCALAWIHAGQPNGHRWLLTALAIVWAADSGAYFAGRKFGRLKLAPRVSPNKTIEGVVGGVLAGVAVGIAFASFAGAQPYQLPAVALVAFVAVLFSVVGDLFESLLKRHAGVKDSGHLIPGHGGILDRVDGVLAALPVFALGKAVLDF
ncbi:MULTISPECIES: phosphatidate cytidylyltransferase [unclassified Lysobacter]|uniref:phosphatidate cytidylyltransferase n=1 Tax=unclassified Lysobacter TaxID=2635362 RepID=UPI0006FC513D|nr:MULTISPECIES: phosphatidate cytidylyltransferase [unclassified Lysobacter]KRA21214.1 phosphatidate cytidylyltransferase [Lysobacter sp. Root604]KRD30530.1 phosphatidate cytidylyltransferase [Lysobacter sp. Root916]KRD80243.1 phosphatidate cytidylyltransferase [Lysobacter sp. Root983]